MHRNSNTVLTKQQRIAQLAKQSPQMGFTSLAHLMDLDWLREAYRRTRKDRAVGVDGQTAAEYVLDFEWNLESRCRARHSPSSLQSAAGEHGPISRKRARPRSPCPENGSSYFHRGQGPATGGGPAAWSRCASRIPSTSRMGIAPQSFAAQGHCQALWKRLIETQLAWVLEIDIQQSSQMLDHDSPADVSPATGATMA